MSLFDNEPEPALVAFFIVWLLIVLCWAIR